MAFHDIRPYRSHSAFIEDARRDTPYRGTTNVYPLGKRAYSDRHYRIRDDGRVDIIFADRQHQDAQEKGIKDSEWLRKRKLATVHPDNTFVIHNMVGQGDAMLLSSVFGTHVHHDSRRGGAVLKHGEQMHPLFEGLRLTMGDFTAVTPYVIHQRTLNRKKAAQAMEQYQEFLAVSPMMLSQMDMAGLHDTAKAVRGSALDGVSADAFELIEKGHYADAAMALAWRHAWQIRWTFGSDVVPNNYISTPDGVVNIVQKVLNDEFKNALYYKADCFNYTEYAPGQLKSSTWKHSVTVDGKEVERL